MWVTKDKHNHHQFGSAGTAAGILFSTFKSSFCFQSGPSKFHVYAFNLQVE